MYQNHLAYRGSPLETEDILVIPYEQGEKQPPGQGIEGIVFRAGAEDWQVNNGQCHHLTAHEHLGEEMLGKSGFRTGRGLAEHAPCKQHEERVKA